MKRYLVGIVLLTATVWTAQGATVGYWRFETDSGTAVTNGQAIVSVDDVSGQGWSLTGNVSACSYRTNIYFADPVPLTKAVNHFMGRLQGATLANSNFNALASTNYCTIEMFFSHLEPHAGFDLFHVGNLTVDLNYDVAGTGITSFRWGISGYAFHNAVGSVNVSNTHHVAVVNSNSYGGATVYLYLDGVLSDSLPGGYLIGAVPGIKIGQIYSYGDYNGYLDEVRISNVALTPNQFLNYVAPPPAGTIISVR